MSDALMVFCTCETQEQAGTIARSLVEGRLAACVNILPPLQSIYRWKGAIERADEILLLIKTTGAAFPAVRDRIRELHSYETPEIVGIPISNADDDYLDWLRQQVQLAAAS